MNLRFQISPAALVVLSILCRSSSQTRTPCRGPEGCPLTTEDLTLPSLHEPHPTSSSDASGRGKWGNMRRETQSGEETA